MNSDFLHIDPLRLDQECIKQPQLYFTYAEKLASAQNEYDEAKADFEVTAAEIQRDIRLNPGSYDLGDKITEAAVLSTLLRQEGHKQAQQAVFDAKHKVGVLQAAVVALEHRKRAVSLLVELRRQEYYSDPKVSPEQRRVMEKVEKDRVRRLGHRREDDED